MTNKSDNFFSINYISNCFIMKKQLYLKNLAYVQSIQYYEPDTLFSLSRIKF